MRERNQKRGRYGVGTEESLTETELVDRLLLLHVGVPVMELVDDALVRGQGNWAQWRETTAWDMSEGPRERVRSGRSEVRTSSDKLHDTNRTGQEP